LRSSGSDGNRDGNANRRPVASVHVGGAPTALTMGRGRLWAGVAANSGSHRGGTLVIVTPAALTSANPVTLSSVDPAFYDYAFNPQFTGLAYDTLVTFQQSPGADGMRLVVHLIRNTFHLASKRDWDALKRDVKPIYTAVNAGAARAALDELADKWGQRYPAIIRLWHNAWEQFIPFLDYDVEIGKVLCSTNAIESLNARYRRAVKARGISRPSRRR
jgi:Transposase, Mutator family